MKGLVKQSWGLQVRRGLRWSWGHKVRLGGTGDGLCIVAPHSAKSIMPDPCCAIMAAGLAAIVKHLKQCHRRRAWAHPLDRPDHSNFERTVVWPRTRSPGASAGRQPSGDVRPDANIMRIRVSSATLPAPQQLERILLSRRPEPDQPDERRIMSRCTAPFPTPLRCPGEVRNRIDMADAAAQAAMKRAIEIDHLADLEIQAANQLNQSIQNAAPGQRPNYRGAS